MKRSVLTSTLLTASLATAFAASPLAGCVGEDDQLLDGEGVKSNDGKDDSSALALFVDFTFSGSFLMDSQPWNVKQAIQDHLLFTIGHLNGDNSVGRLDKLTLISSSTAASGGKVKVSFKVKMPVAWGDKFNVPSTYEFTLPVSAEYDFQNRFATTYGHACVDTGAHDVDSGSMWYYFRPHRSGCSMGSDVYRTTATVTPSPINTTGKFPEFDKVWEDKTLNVLAIFGKFEDGATSHDAGIDAYNTFVASIRTELRNRGTVTSTPATVPTSPGVSAPDVSFTTTLADGNKVNVTALLTDNVLNGLEDPTFRARYEALSEHADYIVYNGHAGLGTNVRALARNGKWVAGQYVIVHMNGCDTFAYIDTALNDAHKAVNSDDTTGDKYIDIVNNGMPAFFASMAGASMTMIRGLLNYDAPKTYEQIFGSVDASQVILVTGEQDNKFVPGGGGTPTTWSGLTGSGTIVKSAQKRYQTPVLAAGNYVFTMTGSADADLYVRIGSAPTTTSYDCRPYKNGSNETCAVSLSAPAPIHVMVRGYATSSDYELVGKRQ